VEISAFIFITGDAVMASNAGIFFAGVGTTFVILAAGFGGGLMLAASAWKEPSGFQNRTAAQPPSPDRVILPSTAEAAQPPQPSQPTQPSQQQIAPAPEPSPPSSAQSMKEAEAPVERQIEKVDTKPTKAESRRKRYAERKARRQAEKAARQQQIEQSEHREAPIMAFGGDEPRRSGGFGFFGN
jgi:outer membrane biosynthesis protein TonB